MQDFKLSAEERKQKEEEDKYFRKEWRKTKLNPRTCTRRPRGYRKNHKYAHVKNRRCSNSTSCKALLDQGGTGGDRHLSRTQTTQDAKRQAHRYMKFLSYCL